MTPDAFAEAVVATPPRCVGSFTTAPYRLGAFDEGASVGFKLGCRRCGGARFAFSEVTSHWSNGAEQAQDAVGLIATCSKCAAPAPLFNAVHDGYDGELGHLKFMQGPATVAALANASDVEAMVLFTYNTSPAELAPLAAEAAVRPQDLFDWFTLQVRADSGQPFQQIWDYECA
ncbi:hypothetical protein [Caulobacter sp. 17J65-9]|uniref:hypothetical protein n=1 Tax=Caulobacter sp. 17J65-9 TaxID=2709382 RepID=UPI0013C78CBE|nr:hypothetical protein [Caulobacter sp. 17J65-9]NEX93979.1 hypothetical protein [Caulobacter sp. 17J65-9]